MAEDKNQHYVPQFYQKYFSEDDKNISLCILESGKTVYAAPIRGQASANYFYSDDISIEKELSHLETLMSSLMKKLICDENYKLDDKELSILYTYVCLQYLRTEVPSANLQKMAEEFAKEYANFLIHEDDFTDNLMVKIPYAPLKSLEFLDDMVRCCLDLKWKFLKIDKDDKSFISSDNPVCYYNLFLEKKGVYKRAYGLVGTFLFLPLSPKLAVLLYDSQIYKVGNTKVGGVVVVKEQDVDNFNILMSVNANKVIFYKNGSINYDCLKQLCIFNQKYTEKTKESNSSTLCEGNYYIQYFHEVFPHLNISFSFIKQLDKARAVNIDGSGIVRSHVRYTIRMKNIK